MKSGSMSSFNAAAPPEARIGGERDDDAQPARTYVVRPRNGMYGVDEMIGTKVIRNIGLFDRQKDADECAAAVGNAYDQGATDQRNGTYKPEY